MLAIIHHKDYRKYDLGEDHPLIGDKPERTVQFFKERSIFSHVDLFTPRRATEEEISNVHDKDYIQLVKTLSQTGGMLALDTPAPKGIYETAALACGGSILAAEKLYEDYDYSMNTLGGFHHASARSSSGFCFFNDIAIAIEHIRDKRRIKRFLIIDLDVHHANGTQDIYYSDPSVLNISFHQDGRTLYPGSGFIHEIGEGEGKGFTVNMPFLPGTGNDSYFYAFEELVPFFIKEFKPEMVIYQSGVDTHHSDPLAQINLTLPFYFIIAREIKNLVDKSCKRLAILLGGGYNSLSSIKAYYNIAAAIVDKEQIMEGEIKDPNLEETKRRVRELKKILRPYWNFKR
ncbi:MAG: acetoin utilization protein AcuC [Thermoplasmata archaeon]|nr:acetoin utilization protein AcuC [Thermoplasmata archaeon]